MHTIRILIFLAPLFALDAAACDCATMSVGQREQESQSVFVARIVGQEPLRYVELAVLEVFKGNIGAKVTVPVGLSDCDFFVKPIEIRPGQEFLIFLSRRKDTLSVNRCLGSAPLAAASADLEYLRANRRRRKQ
jgi:hypothetical protein